VGFVEGWGIAYGCFSFKMRVIYFIEKGVILMARKNLNELKQQNVEAVHTHTHTHTHTDII